MKFSLFQDEDIERIDNISTFEELKDMEEHFRFYYSRDREAIKAMLIKKRKEEREDKKLAKKAKKAEKKAKKMKTITNEEGKKIWLLSFFFLILWIETDFKVIGAFWAEWDFLKKAKKSSKN